MERQPAGQHLVEQEPDRIDVSPGVDRVASYLLGREVSGGPDDHTGARQITLRAVGLGDTKVGDLDAVVSTDEDVGRLDVAMDDPRAVRVMECHCDVTSDARRSVR